MCFIVKFSLKGNRTRVSRLLIAAHTDGCVGSARRIRKIAALQSVVKIRLSW